MTETYGVSTPDRSIDKNATYTLRITGPGDADTPDLLHAEVVSYSVKYSESSFGPICSGFDEYLQGQIIGPRPANPPFPYIGVQVEFGATGTTYTLRTTGVTDSGTLIHTVIGPPALCGTSSTQPLVMWIESVNGTGDRPLPADGKTFTGTYQFNLPPQQINVEWNLVYSAEPKADLEVTKIARTPPPMPGGFIHYDLVVTNHGPDAATNVQLVDAIGTGLERLQVFSSDQATCFASTATCTLPNLASGASFTAMASALTLAEATSVANGASVSSATTDPDSANNSVTVVTPLGTGTCRGVNAGTATPTYEASVDGPGPLDAHLYTFSATVSYCYDGAIAEVLSAAAFGIDDPGFDMGLLSLLGLDFNYLPGPPNESVTVSGFRADISGVFEASVNVVTLLETVLGGRTVLGRQVAEALTKRYANDVAKILDRYGADLAQLESRILLRTKILQSDIEKEISAAFKKVNKVLPDGMTNAIRDKVLAAVRAAFNAFNEEFAQAMPEQLIGLGAEQFAVLVFGEILEDLRELVTVHFEQWWPHIVVQVFPNGNVITSRIGEANPFLKVQQVE